MKTFEQYLTEATYTSNSPSTGASVPEGSQHSSWDHKTKNDALQALADAHKSNTNR